MGMSCLAMRLVMTVQVVEPLYLKEKIVENIEKFMKEV
ncbi:MAG: Unknown protein [uncultured Sulfurovum sp.]|uniref:Uncharacterized protein n=1 Tax=uncultured Sulfurovum sp. TaxID=269237 RepID=A0A6S6RSU8_9BACT|nr:MAG: Unknown protein [uncultured Sulfurovum sp.]